MTAKDAPFPLGREIAFVLLMISSQLLTQAGLGQSIAPLHIIGQDLHASTSVLPWFPAGYSLTVGTFILPAGRLGDVYGAKKVFMFGFALFAVWSLIAGFSAFSHSYHFFTVCRVLQGIGPAFILPNAIAILGRTYPPGPRKGMVFALFGATAPSGFVVGAVFSSIFAQFVWWPWAYWVMGIVLLFVLIMSFFLVPSDKDRDEDQSFDYLGTVTGVSALVFINVAWNQAPIVGWSEPYTYIFLIVGFVMLGLFAYIETRVARHPLLPNHVFNIEINYILACIVCGWGAFGIWVFYYWQFMEEIRMQTPLLTAAQLSTVAVSGFVAAMFTGVTLGRYVKGAAMMIVALSAFCLGSILLAIAPANQTFWGLTFVSLIVMPFGMDISFPAGALIMSDFVSHEDQGIAASLMNTVLNYSISIALGIGGTVAVHVNDDDKQPLKGFRGALYFGIGIAALGVCLAIRLYFVTKAAEKERETDKHQDEKKTFAEDEETPVDTPARQTHK